MCHRSECACIDVVQFQLIYGSLHLHLSHSLVFRTGLQDVLSHANDAHNLRVLKLHRLCI